MREEVEGGNDQIDEVDETKRQPQQRGQGSDTQSEGGDSSTAPRRIGKRSTSPKKREEGTAATAPQAAVGAADVLIASRRKQSIAALNHVSRAPRRAQTFSTVIYT